MSRSLTWLAVLGLIVVLGATNYTIWQRQQVVDNGQPILLQLRPVDPRSLMQGDYMTLRYAETLFPPRGQRSDLDRRGTFVVKLDEHNVATFSRLDDGNQPGEYEVRLKYKQVDAVGRMQLGAESYFFQEGQGQIFSGARYGLLHVDADGTSVLVGLADENWELIQPPDSAAM